MGESSSLIDALHRIQSTCRYEQKLPYYTFHCYDVAGNYFDNCVEQAEQLEQRYQQLTEVARDMFNRAYEFNRDGSCFGGIYIADFREKLEELGVEV